MCVGEFLNHGLISKPHCAKKLPFTPQNYKKIFRKPNGLDFFYMIL